MNWSEAGILGSLISILTIAINVWIGKSSRRKTGVEATALIEEIATRQAVRIAADNDRLVVKCEMLQRRLDEQQDMMEELEKKVEASDHCQTNMEGKIVAQEVRIKFLEDQNKIYRIGLRTLIGQLEKEGCKPAWQLPENAE